MYDRTDYGARYCPYCDRAHVSLSGDPYCSDQCERLDTEPPPEQPEDDQPEQPDQDLCPDCRERYKHRESLRCNPCWSRHLNDDREVPHGQA